jgi:two-component system response regulator FixJ
MGWYELNGKRDMQQTERTQTSDDLCAMPSARQRTLYIVDDDENDRRHTSGCLKGTSFDTRIFECGRSFLETDTQLDNACVLLDVWMPVRDGLAVLEEILQRHRDCPVIMLSGKSTLPVAVEAMKRGAVDFLEKPVESDDLLNAIERAFDLKGGHAPGDLTREQLLGKVTRREGQVLELLAQGHPNKVVAYKLGIAENTVEVHRQKLMRRLEVRNFAELMRLAVKAGI